MLTTHEWAGAEKLRRSLELFARYVIPHFNSGRYNYQAEAQLLADRYAADGSVQMDAVGQPSNLAMK
jgi:hypothetical protein